MKFNKIRLLTADVKEIVKSLKYSESLELNEDSSMIKRKIAFVEPSQKDIDKKTIYIVSTYILLECFFSLFVMTVQSIFRDLNLLPFTFDRDRSPSFLPFMIVLDKAIFFSIYK